MTLPDKDSSVAWGAPGWHDAKDVEDPTTDVSADFVAPMAADTAMATHTQPRAWVEFTTVAYVSGSPSMTVTDHDAVWGSGSDVLPVVTQTAAGVFDVEWPATVTDELGEAHTVNVRHPRCGIVGATNGNAKAVSKSAHGVAVNTFNTSWVANDLAGNTVWVEFS